MQRQCTNLLSRQEVIEQTHFQSAALSTTSRTLGHHDEVLVWSREATANRSDFLLFDCPISPGWIETGDYNALTKEDHAQHPAGRVGTPEDVARTCLFLTDPENSFITGAELIVDGGMTRKMIYVE